MIALGHGLLWMSLLGAVMLSERHPGQGVVFARTAGVLLVLCGSIAGFGVFDGDGWRRLMSVAPIQRRQVER